MNFKRILVLVMTFAMLISTFAPTLGVFAEAANDGHNNESEKKHYVSIGDSMTNGYGFEGYEQGESSHDFFAGEGTYGQGSYALQFEEYLKGIYGAENVDHTMLAASALRAEDLLYLLGGRENPADDWYEEVQDYTGIYDDAALAEYYQNAVKDADIITLGIGNASFGAFMLSRMTRALDVMGGSLDEEEIAMYQLENALALLEDEEAEAFVLDLYNKFCEELNNYVPAEVAEQYKLDLVCDIFAYVTANFIINYGKAIDKIVELNEKENLEIVLIGLMNTTYGMVITLDEENSIPFGDIMDEMFGLLNSYVAGYPATKQTAGAFKGVKFLYAEQPNPDFIVNALDDLANNNWENVDNGRLSADIVRERTINTFNSTLRPMIALGFIAGVNAGIEASVEDGVLDGYRDYVSPSMGDWVYETSNEEFIEYLKTWGIYENYEADLAENMVGRLLLDDFNMLPSITLADVESYEANTPAAWNDQYFFMNVTDCHNLSIAVYLAIEEAIVQSVAVEDIPLSGLQAIAGDLMSVFDGFTPDTTSPVAVYNDLVGFFTTDALLPLVKIYAIFQIGNGMCVHPTPTGHDNLYKEIVKSYETNWTAQKQTVKNVYDYVTEYYDEAYEIAYGVANDMGLISDASNGLEAAINALYVAIDEANAGTLGVTDELKAELVKELYAVIDTLTEIKAVLDSGSAETVEGFVAAVLALEDDLYTHLNNVYAVLAQAGIDVNQLVLLPALAEAIRIINEEVIPAVKAALEALVDAIVAHIEAKVNELCEKVLGFANEVYAQIIATLVRIQLHVQEKLENALAPIINAYFTAIEVLTEIYGSVEEAVRVAGEILTNIIDTITLVGEKVAETVESVVDAYLALVDKLVATYGSVEEALKAANALLMEIVAKVNGAIVKGLELYNAIVDTILSVYGDLENAFIVASQIFSYVYDFIVDNFAPAKLQQMLSDIVNIFVETYGATKDAYTVAAKVYAYLVNALEDTFEGNYELDADSMYVSLGDAVYGAELAELLHLSNKYYNFDLDEDYLDAVAKADLITIRLDNGEVIDFALTRLYDYSTPLDWDKYLDEEGQAALAAILEEIKVELIENGTAAELAGEFQLVVDDMLGFTGGLTVTEEVVAEIVALVIESAVYSYAEFIDRTTVVLENVYAAAPNATVVITGIQNPVDTLDLSSMGIDADLAQYSDLLGYVVDALNAQLIAAAFVNENTVFVGSNDAQDIYNALNVTHTHVYDDYCLDTDCNVCGETREAPGHSFTNYTKTSEADCVNNATETAKCDNCDAETTREIEKSALGHAWGEWHVVTEATENSTGLRERACTRCGETETETVPMLPPEPAKASPWALVAVGVIVVAYVLLTRKKKAPASAKKEIKK